MASASSASVLDHCLSGRPVVLSEVAGNRGLQSTALWVSHLESRSFLPGQTFRWLQPSPHLDGNLTRCPARPFLGSPDPQTVWGDKRLSLGTICYTAIDIFLSKTASGKTMHTLIPFLFKIYQYISRKKSQLLLSLGGETICIFFLLTYHYFPTFLRWISLFL